MTRGKTFNKLREKERQLRREIILDAAECVFASTPFSQVSMRRIAKEAGISAASIYTYFPDQESLFLESYLRRTKDIVAILKKISDEHGAGLLEKMTLAYISYITKQDVYSTMVAHFMLYSNLNMESVEKLNSIEQAVLDCFETAIIKSKVIGNTRLFAHALFASLNGIFITFHNYPGRKGEDVLRHMKRLALIMCNLFVPVDNHHP
jgi:AcrR family transcriptional regulator